MATFSTVVSSKPYFSFKACEALYAVAPQPPSLNNASVNNATFNGVPSSCAQTPSNVGYEKLDPVINITATIIPATAPVILLTSDLLDISKNHSDCRS